MFRQVYFAFFQPYLLFLWTFWKTCPWRRWRSAKRVYDRDDVLKTCIDKKLKVRKKKPYLHRDARKIVPCRSAAALPSCRSHPSPLQTTSRHPQNNSSFSRMESHGHPRTLVSSLHRPPLGETCLHPLLLRSCHHLTAFHIHHGCTHTTKSNNANHTTKSIQTMQT